MANHGISAPKQERSRESFNRVREATSRFLRERGTADFTLAEISAASGVSIGSIYARVSGKTDLLVEVQREEFDRCDSELVTALDRAGEISSDISLEEAVSQIVEVQYESLRENAGVLSAFMALGATIPEISQRGQRSFVAQRGAFVHALARALASHGMRASTEALEWCFELTYSVASRQLGLGVTPGNVPLSAASPRVIVTRVSHTVLDYLERAGDTEPEALGGPAGHA